MSPDFKAHERQRRVFATRPHKGSNMTDKKAEDFFASSKESIETEEKEHTADAEADEWSPESPGQLRGYFMKAQRYLSKKYPERGPSYKAFIKDYDTGVTITVFCARKMLRVGILDASPKVGTLIVFDYQGMKSGKSGYDYHSYYVRAEESDPEYWAEVTRPPAGEMEEIARAQAQEAEASSFESPSDAPY